MKLLFWATITTLTTLDLGVLSYEQFCLRDQHMDIWEDTSQTPTTPPGTITSKQGIPDTPNSTMADVPLQNRMDAQSVYTTLVRGIEKFSFTGRSQPGRLLLTCEGAVPVAVSPSGHVLIAAAQYGMGRVVALAHETYIQSMDTDPDFRRFVLNSIHWLQPHPDALVGIYDLSPLADFLAAEGIKVRSVPSYDSAVGVFCCDAYSATQAKELQEFVKGGGGLLIAGQAWHWSYSNRDKDAVLFFPGNKVIRATGIVFTTWTTEKGVYTVPKEILSSLITDIPIMNRMDAQSVYSTLVRGIEKFSFTGRPQPGRLQLTCEGAVPVAVSPSGHVLIAAAQYGMGRVVALAHAEYIQSMVTDPGFGRFVLNAIHWLKPHPDALVGIYHLSHLADFLVAEGFKVRSVPNYDSGVGVFCCDADSDMQANKLLELVKGGGGLLIAGQAWNWSRRNQGKDILLSFPGNKMISGSGIVFTSLLTNRGVYTVPKEIPSSVQL